MMIINSYRYAGGAAPVGFPLDGITPYEHEIAAVRLRTSYTGFAYILRRSSDNATTSVSFDSNGKVTTNSSVSAGGNLGTWMGADSLFVDTWYEQSGNANHKTQSVAANQLQLADTGVLFSEPRVPSGTGAYVEGTTNIIQTNIAHTVYLVAATNCISGGFTRANIYGTRVTFGSRGAFGVKLADGIGTDWYLAALQGNTARKIRGTTVLSGGTFYKHYHLYDGSVYEVRLNGSIESEVVDTSTIDTPPTASDYIGARYNYGEDGQKIRLVISDQADRSSDRSATDIAINGISWT